MLTFKEESVGELAELALKEMLRTTQCLELCQGISTCFEYLIVEVFLGDFLLKNAPCFTIPIVRLLQCIDDLGDSFHMKIVLFLFNQWKQFCLD